MAAGATAGAGGLLGAVGAIKSGQATQAADNYNAQVAGINSAAVGQEEAVSQQNLGRNITQSIGAMRAQYGASGIDAGQGSAMAEMQQSAAEGVRALASNAFGYQMKQFGYNSQGALDTFAGNQAMQGSYFSAAGSLLQGGSSAANYGSAGGGYGNMGNLQV